MTPAHQAELEQVAREWLDSDNGIYSYNGSTISSLVTLLAARDGDGLSDCGMMIRRLMVRLRKYEPDAMLLRQAQGLLEKYGIQGSVLRTTKDESR